MQWKRRLAIGILSLVALSGCATTGEQMAMKEKSLYDRLGGKPAITAVVDDFVVRVAADRRINRFFANTGTGSVEWECLPILKQPFIQTPVQFSSDPCVVGIPGRMGICMPYVVYPINSSRVYGA